tara:strand:- start:457 stop:615 length:159 start_codon:yes stop_codon:yes gene_type:complete
MLSKWQWNGFMEEAIGSDFRFHRNPGHLYRNGQETDGEYADNRNKKQHSSFG